MIAKGSERSDEQKKIITKIKALCERLKSIDTPANGSGAPLQIWPHLAAFFGIMSCPVLRCSLMDRRIGTGSSILL